MSGVYKIESGIPIPKQKRYREATSEYLKDGYPFTSMKVGDSFAGPAEEIEKQHARSAHWGKKLGMKFTRRKIGETIRIWRTQ